jgi:hypothetical protein
MVDAGFTIRTWNGPGFDILAEETAALARWQEHALGHVDMMFHVLCSLAHPVALEKPAQGMGLSGKPARMTRLQAPRLWAEGRHKEVSVYVAQRSANRLADLPGCRRAPSLRMDHAQRHKKSMPLPNSSVRRAHKRLLV